MAVQKIYIADDFHPTLLEGLEALKVPFTYNPSANRTDIIAGFKGEHDMLLMRSKVSIEKDFLEQVASLKYVGRGGAGMDNIDLPLCESKGIICFNAGEANSTAVAEHTLGVLLSLLRNITSADKEVRNKIWLREENRGRELKSLKIGVIGYGNTGSSFSKMISNLGCTVLAYDKYKKGFGQGRIKECELAELFEKADVISLHIPLNEETRNWVDSEFILKFKKRIILMNMSRGGIVCLKSVIQELDDCKIAGFGTDVWENEKFQTFTDKQESTFELAASKKNVIFTPHIAGWTVESYQKIAEVLLRKIRKLV